MRVLIFNVLEHFDVHNGLFIMSIYFYGYIFIFILKKYIECKYSMCLISCYIIL